MATSKKQYTVEEIRAFGATLSTTDPDSFTAEDTKKVGEYIGSDGCTGVPDWYVAGCIEHDFYYRTKMDFTGKPVSRSYADKRLRLVTQKLSPVRHASPISWVRWTGVRVVGWIFW